MLDIIDVNKLEMLELNITESKISIGFKNEISDNILKQIHDEIFI